MSMFEVIDGAPLAVDALVPMFESPDPAISFFSPLVRVGSSAGITVERAVAADTVHFADDAAATLGLRDSLVCVTDMRQTGSKAVHVAFAGAAHQGFEFDVDPSVAEALTEGVFIVGAETLARKKGFLGWGSAEVVFDPDPEQDVWERDVVLPVVRVHRPKRAGCSTVVTMTASTARGAEATVEAVGTGGGGGVKWTTTLSKSYNAPNRCIEIGHPAHLRIVWGTTLFNGTAISYGTRVTITDVDTANRIEQAVPPKVDACNQPRSSIDDARHLTELIDKRLSKKGETHVQTAKLDREATAKVKIGLDLGKAPLKLGLDMTRSMTDSLSVETTLEAGAAYLGYSPSQLGALELCWTTK